MGLRLQGLIAVLVALCIAPSYGANQATAELMFSGQHVTFGWNGLNTTKNDGWFTMTLNNASTDAAWSYFSADGAIQGLLNVAQVMTQLQTQKGGPWPLTLMLPSWDKDPAPERVKYSQPQMLQFRLGNMSISWKAGKPFNLTFKVWPYDFGPRTPAACKQVSDLWALRTHGYKGSTTVRSNTSVITGDSLLRLTSDVLMPPVLRLLAPRAILFENTTTNSTTNMTISNTTSTLHHIKYNPLMLSEMMRPMVVAGDGSSGPLATALNVILEDIYKDMEEMAVKAIDDEVEESIPFVGQLFSIFVDVLNSFTTTDATESMANALIQYVNELVDAEISIVNANNALIRLSNEVTALRTTVTDLVNATSGIYLANNEACNANTGTCVRTTKMSAINYDSANVVVRSGTLDSWVVPSDGAAPSGTNAALHWEAIVIYQLQWCHLQLTTQHQLFTNFYWYYSTNTQFAASDRDNYLAMVDTCTTVISSNLAQSWMDRLADWTFQCPGLECCDGHYGGGKTVTDNRTMKSVDTFCTYVSQSYGYAAPTAFNAYVTKYRIQREFGFAMMPLYAGLIDMMNYAAHFTLLDTGNSSQFVNRTKVQVNHWVLPATGYSAGMTGGYGWYNRGQKEFDEGSRRDMSYYGGDDLMSFEFGWDPSQGRIMYLATTRITTGRQMWGAADSAGYIQSSQIFPINGFLNPTTFKSITVDTTQYRINYAVAYAYNEIEPILGLTFAGEAWSDYTLATQGGPQNAGAFPGQQTWSVGNTADSSRANEEYYMTTDSIYLCGFQIHYNDGFYKDGGGIYAIWFEWCFITHHPSYPTYVFPGQDKQNLANQNFQNFPKYNYFNWLYTQSNSGCTGNPGGC